MKLLFYFSIVIVIAGIILFLLTRPEFPIDHEIVGKDGRRLSGTVLGKENGVITFERSSDRARFAIPARDLSWADQIFIFRLREEAAPPPPRKKQKDPFIANREQLISELQEKAALFKREIASRTLNEIVQANRTRQVIDIEKEIRVLEIAIENYKYRTKGK